MNRYACSGCGLWTCEGECYLAAEPDYILPGKHRPFSEIILEIERLEPVTVKVRPLNEEILALHQRSAAGLTTPEEEARLTAWCDAREAKAGE